ncbi:hypothetical protein C0J52_06506 [Blattella germanica]|nr:hypothetical protein C0J52_06506 [Blattella germanica]
MELLEPSGLNETEYVLLQSILDDNNITIEQVMKAVTPRCESLLIRCRWKGQVKTSCTEIFRLHKTYEGYCCSFNYVGIKDEIVLIHDPYDYPDLNTVKKIVSVGTHLFFSIPPWVTFATQEVREVPVHNRGMKGCLFPDERELHKMKMYSYNNCITECRENHTLELCGCTPFYYPNNGGYRICNLTDIPCLAENKRKLEIMNPGQEDFTNEEMPIVYPCNCLPDCMNYYYPIESSEGVLSTHIVNDDTFFHIENFSKKYDAVFNVYFSHFMVTRYRRDVLYSWRGLLASLGGLLSLFIGFSLIGAVELFYFFTFRLYYKLRLQQPRRIQPSTQRISTFQVYR